MNRSPILFRCDGTATTGWDHFYRCLTYAAALQRRRRPTHVLAQLSPTVLAAAIHRSGSEWINAEHPIGSPEDCEHTIREIHRLGAAGVIVSGTNLPSGYLKELASTGTFLTVVDHEAEAHFPKGLMINPLLAPGSKAYRFDPGTQLLLGKRYAIVRPVFRRQRPLRAQEPAQPFKAILALGDDDSLGQTLPRTKELLAISRVEKISVVVRSHHHQLDDLRELAREYSQRMEVITEPNEIATRLGRCHFAITSGDSWSIEFACVGIPQLVLAQNQSHLLNGQRLDEEGAATFLGNAAEVSEADLRQSVHVLLSDPLERLGMSRCARQLIDGRGPDRIVTALEIMLHAQEGAQPEQVAA